VLEYGMFSKPPNYDNSREGSSKAVEKTHLRKTATTNKRFRFNKAISIDGTQVSLIKAGVENIEKGTKLGTTSFHLNRARYH